MLLKKGKPPLSPHGAAAFLLLLPNILHAQPTSTKYYGCNDSSGGVRLLGALGAILQLLEAKKLIHHVRVTPTVLSSNKGIYIYI